METIFRALDAPRRREILRMVWDRERCAGEICRGQRDITFGAVSQHLRVLEDAGLISCRHDGRRRYYVAKKAEMGSLAEWLESMWDQALYRLKIRAELEQARRGPHTQEKRRHRS